jgi:hypothetical protein
MLLACAVLIGNLCVPPQYLALTRAGAMVTETDSQGRPLPLAFDPALSRRAGIEIVPWSSDMIEGGLSFAMNRVCASGWCVFYRKHCSDSWRLCEYSVSNAIVDVPGDTAVHPLTRQTGIDIRAPSRAAMRRIIGELGFVVHSAHGFTLHADRDPAAAVVPLARLNVESPDATHVIDCMRSVWVQGCERPAFPQFEPPAHR